MQIIYIHKAVPVYVLAQRDDYHVYKCAIG